MALAGRLAIIAGGFGGLGSATGKLLQSQGAKLALLYAPFESSRKSSIIKESYDHADIQNITTYECDITSHDAVSTTFSTIAEDLATSRTAKNTNPFPSILVNAAGYVSTAPLVDTTSTDALANLHSNLLGPLFVSQAFARLYRQRSHTHKSPPPGRIVSISSQAAHVALPDHGAYCASKAGLLGLTRCMASEWGPWGITANTVSPTVAMTVLGKKAWADEERRRKHLSEIPTGRFAQPQEIAEAIAFLCQDGNGMINGADLRVDGGFTIR
ncbi:MAG: hypothetical protein M1820_010301 [Bogoriella megaspora]|nr:MAG: hypothetical protein M1820_010301 [Bogoriella megaspora]